MTPHELNLCITEYAEKTKRENEFQLYLVYAGQKMRRWKKLPEFERLIKQSATKQPQTAEQMLQEIKKLNAAMGGETV